jgi:serine/threonine protein kinase
MAPELFSEQSKDFDGFAADMYSLGATLYTLAVGCPPFMANSLIELVEKIRTEPVLFPRCVWRCQFGSTTRMPVHVHVWACQCLCIPCLSSPPVLPSVTPTTHWAAALWTPTCGTFSRKCWTRTLPPGSH